MDLHQQKSNSKLLELISRTSVSAVSLAIIVIQTKNCLQTQAQKIVQKFAKSHKSACAQMHTYQNTNINLNSILKK